MVAEFFVCWCPIFIVDTLALYQPELVYNWRNWIGIDIISACHLLCFCSSCTNPVTYAFMNRRFRRHFRALFFCHRRHTTDRKMVNNTANIENESSLNHRDNSASFACDSSFLGPPTPRTFVNSNSSSKYVTVDLK